MGQKVKNILRIRSSRTFAYKVKNTLTLLLTKIRIHLYIFIMKFAFSFLLLFPTEPIEVVKVYLSVL